MDNMSKLYITLNVVSCVSLEFFVVVFLSCFCFVLLCLFFMNYLHLNCTCEGQHVV